MTDTTTTPTEEDDRPKEVTTPEWRAELRQRSGQVDQELAFLRLLAVYEDTDALPGKSLLDTRNDAIRQAPRQIDRSTGRPQPKQLLPTGTVLGKRITAATAERDLLDRLLAEAGEDAAATTDPDAVDELQGQVNVLRTEVEGLARSVRSLLDAGEEAGE